MIDILKQHAREKRLTVVLFVIIALMLYFFQWRIGTYATEVIPSIPAELK